MNDACSTQKAVCPVCPHACALLPGQVGICGARANEDGTVASLNYGECTALALDPIEKKPLARFHPGSMILSYGSFGCNLRCAFCQNSDISMVNAANSQATFLSAEDLVRRAQDAIPLGNIGVALTYNEPMIAPEYIHDVGTLLHGCALSCVVVTNGFVNRGIFDELLPAVDAMNVDLKCFTDAGYASVGAPGGLEVVKDTIATSVAAGTHVEVTTLVVPGLSSDVQDFEAECAWLASVSSEIPLHLSRFFPSYKMCDVSATDVGLLHEFATIARRYLAHVYLGNV